MAFSEIASTLPFLGFLGFMVGMLGTLVGAGGGFILVPMLVYILPGETADRVTSISMAVVFFNALSGTLAYARMRRVDFSSGWRFAVAAMPGAFIGAYATSYIPRMTFDRVLGFALVIGAVFLLYNTFRKPRVDLKTVEDDHESFQLDKRGRRIGAGLSACVSFVSSSLGIGGGIVHVPALIYLLGYPVHIATATSHFVLACTSMVAVGEHILQGSYSGNVGKTAVLAVGAVLGAQIGARLSRRLKGPTIIRWLAVALAFAGLRIALRTFGH